MRGGGLLLGALLIAAVFPLGARGNTEEQELRGRISVTGNEPFTMVVLVTAEGSYELLGEAAETLRRDHQGAYARLSVRPVDEDRGPGRPARVKVDRILEIRTEPW